MSGDMQDRVESAAIGLVLIGHPNDSLTRTGYILSRIFRIVYYKYKLLLQHTRYYR